MREGFEELAFANLLFGIKRVRRLLHLCVRVCMVCVGSARAWCVLLSHACLGFTRFLRNLLLLVRSVSSDGSSACENGLRFSSSGLNVSDV